jgi:hypothetical protein
MDPKEEAEFRAIEWKADDKGRPRRLPADYIMRKDPDARRAYLEMRSNLGLSHEEAELRIERLSEANFHMVLFHEGEDYREADRRPEMWVQLARGFSVEEIFPNLEEISITADVRYCSHRLGEGRPSRPRASPHQFRRCACRREHQTRKLDFPAFKMRRGGNGLRR